MDRIRENDTFTCKLLSVFSFSRKERERERERERENIKDALRNESFIYRCIRTKVIGKPRELLNSHVSSIF
jgi:hypothetical protein